MFGLFRKKPVDESVMIYPWMLDKAYEIFPQRFVQDTTTKPERISRFEAISAVAAATMWYLQQHNQKQLVQNLHDVMFDDFDAALREQGVGDLKVGKEIKKLAGAFYGRLEAYTPAFEKQDTKLLEEAMNRNHALEKDEDHAHILQEIMALAHPNKAADAWLEGFARKAS